MAERLLIKVRSKRSGEDNMYRNDINLYDANLLALVLLDLKSEFNAPIDKACSIVLSKSKTFPI
jgi:hypothetical protein